MRSVFFMRTEYKICMNLTGWFRFVYWQVASIKSRYWDFKKRILLDMNVFGSHRIWFRQWQCAESEYPESFSFDFVSNFRNDNDSACMRIKLCLILDGSSYVCLTLINIAAYVEVVAMCSFSFFSFHFIILCSKLHYLKIHAFKTIYIHLWNTYNAHSFALNFIACSCSVWRQFKLLASSILRLRK